MPLIQTMEDALKIVRRLEDPATKRVCYDSETSGLDWRRNHIVGHVLTFSEDPNDSFYLPVRHHGGGNIGGCSTPDEEYGWDGSDHPFEVELRRVTRQRTDIGWLAHNFAFDMRFLARHNIHLQGRFEDTGINAPLLNEYEGSYSLDALSRNAGVQAKKGEPLYEHIASKYPQFYTPKKKPGKAVAVAGKDAMAHFWRTNAADEVVWDYAVGDGTSTWQLRDVQHVRLAEEGLLRVWDYECRMIPILHRMTMRGIKIDLARLEEVELILKDRLAQALQKFPDGFNPRSPDDVKKLIIDSNIDLSNAPRTKPSRRFPEGQVSFNEAFLKTVPIGREVLAARKYAHILSAFLEPMRDKHIHLGRCHAEYNQLRGDEFGTITGRLSSNNPNLQQVPKRNKELGPLFRSIFLPDEGKIWGSADYSQCEPRLLAYYGRVRVLLEGYRAAETVDAHTAVARAANIDRDDGKRLNQALLTGAGVNKIIEMLGKSDASTIVDEYFAAMPEIRPLQKRASLAMRSRGYIVSLLGRRARLETGRDYVGVNRLLQCGNADILKQKMVEADEYLASEGYPVDILTNIHDAVDSQFAEENRKHYIEMLNIMANFGPDDVIPLDLPMEIDSGEGANWAEASYGSKGVTIRGRYCPPRELQEKAA